MRENKKMKEFFREIIELCAIISDRGFEEENGTKSILFKDLFNAYRFVWFRDSIL